MSRVIDLYSANLSDSNLALCLGFFDGLHLGHQKVINEAKKCGSTVGLLTFESQIKYNLGRNENDMMLTSMSDRLDLLDKFGVDYLFPLTFTDELKNTSSEEFIKLIIENTHAKYLVCGLDFKFGKNASGDINTLKNFEKEYGYKTIAVDLLSEGAVKISSSDIINLIKNGEITEANSLLGYNYTISGVVDYGLSNGRKIGYRTANIKLSFPYVMPKNGVYATVFQFGKRRYLSMTNVGTHPTIDSLPEPIIETNVFNYNSEMYGNNVKIEFICRTRDEIKFKSIDELRNQLNKDKDEIIAKYSQYIQNI